MIRYNYIPLSQRPIQTDPEQPGMTIRIVRNRTDMLDSALCSNTVETRREMERVNRYQRNTWITNAHQLTSRNYYLPRQTPGPFIPQRYLYVPNAGAQGALQTPLVRQTGDNAEALRVELNATSRFLRHGALGEQAPQQAQANAHTPTQAQDQIIELEQSVGLLPELDIAPPQAAEPEVISDLESEDSYHTCDSDIDSVYSDSEFFLAPESFLDTESEESDSERADTSESQKSAQAMAPEAASGAEQECESGSESTPVQAPRHLNQKYRDYFTRHNEDPKRRGVTAYAAPNNNQTGHALCSNTYATQDVLAATSRFTRNAIVENTNRGRLALTHSHRQLNPLDSGPTLPKNEFLDIERVRKALNATSRFARLELVCHKQETFQTIPVKKDNYGQESESESDHELEPITEQAHVQLPEPAPEQPKAPTPDKNIKHELTSDSETDDEPVPETVQIVKFEQELAPETAVEPKEMMEAETMEDSESVAGSNPESESESDHELEPITEQAHVQLPEPAPEQPKAPTPDRDKKAEFEATSDPDLSFELNQLFRLTPTPKPESTQVLKFEQAATPEKANKQAEQKATARTLINPNERINPSTYYRAQQTAARLDSFDAENLKEMDIGHYSPSSSRYQVKNPHEKVSGAYEVVKPPAFNEEDLDEMSDNEDYPPSRVRYLIKKSKK